MNFLYETPIVKNFLDVDLYKFTMWQAIFHNYRYSKCSYRFVNRSAKSGVKLGELINALQDEVQNWGDFRFTPMQLIYLESLGYFKEDFLDYLSNFKINPDNLKIKLGFDGDLDISTNLSSWCDTIWYETAVLSTVNELYYIFKNEDDGEGPYLECFGDARVKLYKKCAYLKQNPLPIMEFGTRRRFSAGWQEEVLTTLLKNTNSIVGTSNVHLAMTYNIPCLGTMAHEFLSGHLGLVKDIKDAQRVALNVWGKEYGDKLAVALTDTFTTDSFFRDMDEKTTNFYTGLRHDSGCPFEFGEKALAHYKKFNIDPMNKKLVFSDGLDLELATQIQKRFANRIKVVFGIGTSLTNDMGGSHKPLSIVMKLVQMQKDANSPVVECVKLSDNPEKAIGEKSMVEAVKKAYGVN